MESNTTTPLSEVPPPKQEVDDLLRRKRKAREHKACYPCRQRKVKCDLNRPCRTCVEREHPELCDYHPPNKRQETAPTSNGTLAHSDAGGGGQHSHLNSTAQTVTINATDFHQLLRKLDGVEKSLEDMRREVRNGSSAHTGAGMQRAPFALSGRSSPNSGSGTTSLDPNPNGPSPLTGRYDNPFTRHTAQHGIHARNDLTGQTVHLGGASVPALVMALGQGNREQPAVQEILGKSILPIFGLDNETATYPFVDLWGLAHGSLSKAEELAKAIPSDNQCLSFFRYYRDMGNVIFPGLADIGDFENDLTQFLMIRSGQLTIEDDMGGLSNGISEQAIHGKSLQWIGLLFAVLASGCQCSGLPRKERELTSQVYVCCSFECLRFTNFLSHATLDNIQTLLILGNVISNNMNAGTAWSLLGLTTRLAQSLGLHRACPPSTSLETSALRSKIWWALLWQDSLLSITYDRASSTALMDHNSMPIPTSYMYPGMIVPAYHASMYGLCKVGLNIVRDRTKVLSTRELYERIKRHRDEIETIVKDSAEYLRDSRKCRSVRDSLEHWALYLHTSYIVSELCRPAISPSTADEGLSKAFKQTCIESLVNTVEAFLGLQNITQYAIQSWASVHRSLSSALLLGIMGEHLHNERARKLLGRFVALMSETMSSVDPAELSAPMERAISALKKLNIQESVAPNAFNMGELGMGDGRPGAESQADQLKMEDWAMYSNPSGGSGNGSVEHSSTMAGSGSGPEMSEEYSPYSVLNSILWGQRSPP